MAEGDDGQDKTEEPTQKKIDDAREKGQVASSKEINHWFIILAGAIFIGALGPAFSQGLASRLSAIFDNLHSLRIESPDFATYASLLLQDLAILAAAPAALFIVAAVLSNVIQNGFLISVESITPKLEKISPLKGMKRLFSSKSMVEFAKGILKLVIVGVVVVLVLSPEMERIELLAGAPLALILTGLHMLVLKVMIAVVAVMTVIAVIDFIFQKFTMMKELRMSRQDLKEEFKQTEGDPMVKQRLRQIRMDRQRTRMMAAVPEADVVITNPTHFAVALKYDQASMDAPIVVAKGADHVAFRIREVANENNIAIVENPPLARALHAAAEVDQPIPAEHYRAVAEIISFVWRASGKL